MGGVIADESGPLPALPRRPGEGKKCLPSAGIFFPPSAKKKDPFCAAAFFPPSAKRGEARWGALLPLPLPLLLLLFATQLHAADVIDWFATPDQQGRWYFEHGEYKQAAAHFRDPAWKGLAYYRAADYANALAEFSKLDSADGFFLQANAQARLGKYEAAVKSYTNAIEARAEFPQAKHNRDLVTALIPKPDDENTEDAPDLPPDQVQFDDKGKKGKEKTMDAAMLRKVTADLWMKNLKVSPADFLRQKFQIEAEEK